MRLVEVHAKAWTQILCYDVEKFVSKSYNSFFFNSKSYQVWMKNFKTGCKNKIGMKLQVQNIDTKILLSSSYGEKYFQKKRKKKLDGLCWVIMS